MLLVQDPSESNILLHYVALSYMIQIVPSVLLICEGREKFHLTRVNNVITPLSFSSTDSLASSWAERI